MFKIYEDEAKNRAKLLLGRKMSSTQLEDYIIELQVQADVYRKVSKQFDYILRDVEVSRTKFRPLSRIANYLILSAMCLKGCLLVVDLPQMI